MVHFDKSWNFKTVELKRLTVYGIFTKAQYTSVQWIKSLYGVGEYYMNRILYIILCMQWFRNFEVYHEHISLGKGSHLCAMNCLWRLLLYSHLEGGSRWCGVGQVVLQRGHAPSDTKVSISWSNLHCIACSVLFFSAMHQCRGSIYDHEYNTLSIGHEFITQNVVSKMAVVHL